MEEVSELVEFEGEDGGRDQVVVSHQLRKLLFLLHLHQLCRLLLNGFFESAIYPKLDGRVTRSSDHLQHLSLLTVTSLTARRLKEVHGPDLFLMHLERVLALLLSEIPHLDDAVDASCCNLHTSIEPGDFHERLCMALEGSQALSRPNVPHFAGLVT